MSRYPGGVLVWWDGRTQRERRMVMVLGGLILATAVWLGVVRPVQVWRTAAADRAQVAAVTLAEVRRTVGLLQPAPTAAVRPPEGLDPLIQRTADTAGVEVVTTMSPSGQLGFQVSGVGSASLFAWLWALETDHRLAICSLGVTENADATLNVEGSVSADTCMG